MTPAERLSALEPGEVLSGKALLAGLAPEQKVEVVCKSKSQAGAVTLELQFMGIKLATAAGKAGSDGKIIWWEAK